MSTHEKDSLRQRSPHANRIRLGKLLEKYDGRILGGIRMTIDKSSGVPSRYKYGFVKLEDEPGIIVKYPRYRPPGWQEILLSKRPPGWEKIIEAEELNRQKEQGAKRRQNDGASKPEECVPEGGVGEKGTADSECRASQNNAENNAPSRSAEAPVRLAPNLQKNDVCKGELPNTTGFALANQPTEPTNLVKCSEITAKIKERTCRCVGSVGQIPAQTNCETKKDSPRRTENVRCGAIYFSSAGGWTRNQPTEPTHLHPPFLALDIETCAKRGADKRDAFDPWTGEIRLVSLADSDSNISQLDLRELDGGKLPDYIAAAFERHTLVAHNAAFELRWLGAKLAIWPQKIFCTMTAARLLSPLRSILHDLGAVLERYLGIELPKELGNSDWGAFQLTKEQIDYARNDVRYLIQLAGTLQEALAEKQLQHVFALEMALLPLVTRMEVCGIRFNCQKARLLLSEIQAKRAEKTRLIQVGTGIENFNPESSTYCVEYFKAQGFKMRRQARQGKDRESAAEDVLCSLDDPLASEIIACRRLSSLASAVASMLGHVQADGRIHSQYHQTGTTTGRFTSSDPNMQQVPKRHAEYGRQIRALYEASAPGRCLVRADYSQFELRGVARIAPEPVMRRAFLDGGSDLHRKIVALALGLTPEEVTEEQRNGLGKPSNFGFIYGRGAESWRIGIRKDLAILLSAGQAEAFRRSFFKLYPGIAAWHARSELLAKDPANNSARTPFGRQLLAQGESEWDRFALLVNYPIQGGTADVIKLAIVMIAGQLPLDVHLVIMAHDELVYDCPAELAEEVAQIVQTNMGLAFAQVLGSEIPCEVDVQILSNWGGI